MPGAARSTDLSPQLDEGFNSKFLSELISETFVEQDSNYYKYINEGVTCWMNSTLQFLNQIISYKKYIISTDVINEFRAPNLI